MPRQALSWTICWLHTKKGTQTKTTHTINMHVCVHEVRIRDFRAVAVIALGPGIVAALCQVPAQALGTGGTRARSGTSLGTCPRYTCGTPRGRWPSRCACPWVLGVGECPVAAARRVEWGAPSVLGGGTVQGVGPVAVAASCAGTGEASGGCVSCTRSGCGGSSYTGFVGGISAALLAAGGVVATNLPCRFGFVGPLAAGEVVHRADDIVRTMDR